MTTNNLIEKTKGNTPVVHIPPDYYPPDCGYWYVIPEGMDAGKKLFFRDSIHGQGEPVQTIVFVHGNPESSYIYRHIVNHVIASAKKTFRIVAVDHIGFGLSDQASYEMVSMDHAANLIQLVRHLDLNNVTLVIHDWGGPIGIGAFLKDPERVDNLIITNTTVFPIPEAGLTFNNYPIRWLPWAMGPKIIPTKLWGAYAAYAIFRTPATPFKIIGEYLLHVVKIALDFSGKKEIASQKFYREQLSIKMNALSSKRLVRQSGVWASGNTYIEPKLGQRDTGPFYRFIQENISKLWGPDGRNIGVYALLGRWDPLAKDEVIAQWIAHLPQLESNVETFEAVGHFIEEVKYKEIALAILNVSGLA